MLLCMGGGIRRIVILAVFLFRLRGTWDSLCPKI